MAAMDRGATPEQPPAQGNADDAVLLRRPCGLPVTAGTAGESVLVVAVCGGYRCRALRTLHGPSAATDSTGEVLRHAVRRRPGSVLISTGCLGPCALGCVAAVGTGIATNGELCWTGRPVGLGMVDIPHRTAALAAWITSSAPDLATLPETLWRTGVSSDRDGQTDQE